MVSMCLDMKPLNTRAHIRMLYAGSLQNVNERIMGCEASQHNHSCVTVADSYHHVTKGILPNATVL
jgi:hypothetical protein